MKQLKTFLSLLLLAILTVSTTSITVGKPHSSSREHQRYILIDKTVKRPARPRSLQRPTIDCIYDGTTESLSFQFYENIGGVTITVSNTTTGEIVYDMCSSTPGACSVGISGDEGDYDIQLEDENGVCYSGSFYL